MLCNLNYAMLGDLCCVRKTSYRISSIIFQTQWIADPNCKTNKLVTENRSLHNMKKIDPFNKDSGVLHLANC